MSALIALTIASFIQTTAFTFDDALHDIVPGSNGFQYANEFIGLMGKTSLKMKRSEETREFMQYVEKSLSRFDFIKLYSSDRLDDFDNGYRGITLQGCTRDDFYQINLVPPETAPCDPPQLWDYTTRYALKKNDNSCAGGRSFISTISSKTYTQKYSHRNLLSFAEGLLKVLDPRNIKSLTSPGSNIFANITGNSRKLADEFYRAFPHLSEILNNYAIIRSLLEIKEHEGRSYTHFEMRYGYNYKNIKNDFPNLSKYLNDMKNLYRLSLTVNNNSGHTFLSLIFDSREDAFRCSFYTRKGKIIPIDENGAPIFEEEFSLTRQTKFSNYAVLDLLYDVHGLKFETNNVLIRFNYTDTPQQGIWLIKLEKAQKTKIWGELYHIIPAWLVDLVIPSNLEQLIYDFSRVMQCADGGKGSRIIFRWDTSKPGKTIFHFNAISEFIDNYFVRYGLKIWSKKAQANKKIDGEINLLRERVIAAITADLEYKKK